MKRKEILFIILIFFSLSPKIYADTIAYYSGTYYETDNIQVGDTVLLKVYLEDNLSSPISGQAVTFTIVDSATNAYFESNSSTEVVEYSDSTGISTAVIRTDTNAAVTTTIQATAPLAGSPVTFTVDVVPGPVTIITDYDSPAWNFINAYDTILLGDTINLAQVVKDQYSNLVSGAQVTYYITNTPNVSLLDTSAHYIADSDTSHTYTDTSIVYGGIDIVTPYWIGYTSDTGYIGITFVPDLTAPGTNKLKVTSGTAVIDAYRIKTTPGPAYYVEFFDTNDQTGGDLVAGDTVSLTALLKDISGNAISITDTVSFKVITGTGYFTSLYPDAKADSPDWQIVSGTPNIQYATIQFVCDTDAEIVNQVEAYLGSAANPIDSYVFDLHTIPLSPDTIVKITSDTSNVVVRDTVTLKVQILDVYNNEISGETVTVVVIDGQSDSGQNSGYLISKSGTSASGIIIYTNDTGIAQIDYRLGAYPDTNIVRAYSSSVNDSVYFYIGGVPGAPDTIILEPRILTGISADTNYITITGTVKNAYGNPVSDGTMIVWSIITDASDSSLSIVNDTTINGLIQTSLTTSHTSGDTYYVRATSVIGGVMDTTGLLTVVAGEEKSIALSPNGAQNIVVNSVNAVQATVQDSWGNAVSGVAVTFSLKGGNGTLSDTAVVTDASGSAQVIYTAPSTANLTDTISVSTVVMGLVSVTDLIYTSVAGSAVKLDIQPDVSQTHSAGEEFLITIRALDVSNNVATNCDSSVTLSKGISSIEFTSPSPVTLVNGITVVTVANTVEETAVITASAPSLTSDTLNIITIHDTAASILVTVDSTSVSADAGTVTITATVKDKYGNNLNGEVINWTKIGAGNLSADSSIIISGVATAQVANLTTAGDTVYVVGTIGSVSDTSAAVAVQSGAASTIAVSPSAATNVNADTNNVTIYGTVKDAQGNMVSDGASIVWSILTDAADSSLSVVNDTTISGLVQTVLTTSHTAGDTYYVVGTSGSVSDTSATITVASGAVSTITVSPAIAAQVNADTNNIMIYGTVKDAYGNMAVDNTAVDWSIITDAAGSSLSVVNDTTISGLVQTVLTTSHTAGDTYYVAGTSGSASGTTALLTVIVGEEKNIALNPNGSQGIAVSSASAGQAAVHDSWGNAVSGVAVTFILEGGNGVLSDTAGVTDTSGIAQTTYTAPSISDLIDTINVSADVGALMPDTDLIFMSVVGNVAQIDILPDASQSNVAGIEFTITVRALDSLNNIVTTCDSSITLSRGTSSIEFTPASPVTLVNGITTVTVENTVEEAAVITASAVGDTSIQADTLTVITLHDTVPSVTVTVDSVSVSADVASVTITATVTDVYGNNLNGEVINWTKIGAGNLSTDSTVISNGIASVSVTGLMIAGDTVFVVGAVGSASGTSATAVVAPGAVSAITAGPSAATDVNADTNNITIYGTVKDAQGNMVADGTSVTWSIVGAGGSLSVVNDTTINGLVQTILTTSHTAGDTYYVVGTSGSVSGTSGLLTMVAGQEGAIALSPNGARSIVVNSASVVQATVKDSWGNAVSGVAVTFSLKGGNGTLSDTAVVTDASGLAQTIYTAPSAANLIDTISVSTVVMGLVPDTDLIYTSVPSVATRLDIQPDVSQAQSAGEEFLITIRALDVSNNVATTCDSSVTLSKGTSSIEFTPSSPVTLVNGITVVTVANTIEETAVITANAAGLTSDSLTVVTLHDTAASITITVYSASVSADAGTVTITATIKDKYGNNLNGEVINWTKIGAGNLSADSGIISNGIASVSVTGLTIAGDTVFVIGEVGSVSGTSASVTAQSGAVTSIAVSSDKSSLIADGSTAATITATVTDQYGNPISGESVTIITDIGSVSPASGITDARGVIETTYTAGTQSGTATITVSAGAAAAYTALYLNGVNNAPVADAGADTTVHIGDTVVLDGSSSSDTDGDALSYYWMQVSGETVTIGDSTHTPSSDIVGVHPAQAGTYVFALSVVTGGTRQWIRL